MRVTKISGTVPFPKLNHWHFVLALYPYLRDRDILLFQFGLFKIIEWPPEGEMFQKRHYKGFWFKWLVRAPSFGWGYNFEKKYGPRDR